MAAAAVTGLEAEARIVRHSGLAAAASGGVAARTAALAESFLRDGASPLLSFGIAGALAPRLASGTLLLPQTVIGGSGQCYSVDEAMRARLAQALMKAGLTVESGAIFGAAQAVATADAKADLFRATGAVAIDLESHIVAAAAGQARRPFLVLRAIADPASRSLPSAAIHGLDEKGRPALGRVLREVMRDPRQIPALLRLAGETRRALAMLRLALQSGVRFI